MIHSSEDRYDYFGTTRCLYHQCNWQFKNYCFVTYKAITIKISTHQTSESKTHILFRFIRSILHLHILFKPHSVSIMALIPLDTGQGGRHTEDPQQHFTSPFKSRLKKLTTTINFNNSHSEDKRVSLAKQFLHLQRTRGWYGVWHTVIINLGFYQRLTTGTKSDICFHLQT